MAAPDCFIILAMPLSISFATFTKQAIAPAAFAYLMLLRRLKSIID